MTALHAAILSGSEQEAEVLLTMGADVKAIAANRTHPAPSCRGNRPARMAKLLLEHGPNSRPRTPPPIRPQASQPATSIRSPPRCSKITNREGS